MKKVIKAIFMITFVLVFCLAPIYAAPEVGPGWYLALQGEINWPTNFMGFVNEKNGITVGPNGECHYTEDGGKTWPRANNESGCRYDMDILGDSTAWTCGAGGHIRCTKDGGKNWGKLTDCGFAANLISFNDLTNGWIGAPDMNKLVATNDGGMSWNPVDPPSQVNQMTGIITFSATTGYVLEQESDVSVLYLTQDSGKTWQKQSTVCKGTLKSLIMRFSDPKQGIIIGNFQGEMMSFSTTGGGKNWRRENVFSKVCMPFLTRDGKTLTLMGYDNVYFVLTRK